MLSKLSKKKSLEIDSEFERLLSNLDDWFLPTGMDVCEVLFQKCIFGMLDKKYNPKEITTYNEIYELSNAQMKVDKEFVAKKEIAPDWKVALNLIIQDIGNSFLSNYYDEMDGMIEFENIIGSTYQTTNKGEKRYISIRNDISKYFSECHFQLFEPNDKRFNFKEIELLIINMIQDFVKGISYAYTLPKLEKELKELDSGSEINETSIAKNDQKLKWLGKPSHFGLIIDLLIQNNYIKKPTKYYTTDAKFYLNLFDIDTTEETLVAEISEKKNSVSIDNRKLFKLPKHTKNE